jgi:hypothetical protein
MGRYGYNKQVFKSLTGQTFSALAGYTVVALGFVEQTVSYIPYKTTYTALTVSIILLISNIIFVNGAYF